MKIERGNAVVACCEWDWFGEKIIMKKKKRCVCL